MYLCEEKNQWKSELQRMRLVIDHVVSFYYFKQVFD